MRFEIACALSSKIRIADGGRIRRAHGVWARRRGSGADQRFCDQRARGHARDARGTGVRRRPWSDMVADRASAPNARVSAFPGRARVISDEPANED
ncbi:MAG: hypothetical protein ACLU37_07990 [Collinsella sp.]